MSNPALFSDRCGGKGNLFPAHSASSEEASLPVDAVLTKATRVLAEQGPVEPDLT